MNDLTPLLASSDDELELALLTSMDGDEPGPDAFSKTALALGLGAAVATTASTAGGATASAAAPSAVAATTKPAGITLLAIVKWLAVGAGAGLFVSGAAHLATRRPAAPRAPVVQNAAPRQAPATPAQARPGTPPAAPENAPLPPHQPATTPPAARAVVDPRPEPAVTDPIPAAPSVSGQSSASFEPDLPAPATPAARASATSSLRDETQALDRVRRSLEARRAAEALAELDRFRERWPRAALRAEALVLRVEALLLIGERKSAEREAETLIRVAPHSRHAARVRELLSR